MKIEELREQSEAMTEERDLLVLHRELNELRAEATVLGQQQEFMESWGSTVDPTEYLHDDPDYAMGIVTADGYQHISQVGDRQNGENYPTFRTEQELGAIRGAARILCDVFPTAKTAKENLLCFVLGTGFTCKPVGEETCADDLLAAVQAAVKRFFRCNQWAAIEEEIYWRPHRDGESFLALVGNPGEMPELRIVEPEQVTEPTSAAEIEEWLR